MKLKGKAVLTMVNGTSYMTKCRITIRRAV
jgi:hypothetical protein